MVVTLESQGWLLAHVHEMPADDILHIARNTVPYTQSRIGAGTQSPLTNACMCACIEEMDA